MGTGFLHTPRQSKLYRLGSVGHLNSEHTLSWVNVGQCPSYVGRPYGHLRRHCKGLVLSSHPVEGDQRMLNISNSGPKFIS